MSIKIYGVKQLLFKEKGIKEMIKVKPVKAQSKSYGYSLMLIAGEKPSYVTANPFFWYRYKSDAQKRADYINATGRV